MRTTRRQWLCGAGAAMATAGRAQAQGDSDAFVCASQELPAPKISLPTDALPRPSGPRKRLAAVTTCYFKYSHADDIITKFIEGYSVVGRVHVPHCEVVSLAIEQFPATDIGRGMAARYGIPLYDSPAQAVTCGGDRLAVDGVLIVGEHGDYPTNAKGQQLYPRRRLFEEVMGVFERSGRSVPVYNDKHFSYSWLEAEWMYRQSRRLGFGMMAGSSVPVTWRQPALAFRPGVPLESALAVGYGGVEAYGFHTLELLQCFVEKRPGGETGVQSVQCLSGAQAWSAGERGRWSVELLAEAIRHTPDGSGRKLTPESFRQNDPEATVFLVEYRDGFRAAAFVSHGMVAEFAFASSVRGRTAPVGTWCTLPKPQRDHFSFLCNHLEVMFRTGRPSYPVERTYLVTGMLEALLDSRAAGGCRVPTPHLAAIAYEPAAEWGVR